MNVGDKIYKNDTEQMQKYSEYVSWCSNNKAYITDKGEYYEIVAMPTPQTPTEEQLIKIEAIKQKSTLMSNALIKVISMLTGGDLQSIRSELKSELNAISDNVALEIPDVFPVWSSNSIQYEKGDRILYNNVLYKVLTSHTSQESWKPDISPSLFVKVISSIGGEIPEWQQPSANNAYMKGDKVRYNGRVYVSLIDNNVWSPEGYPDGWQDITGEE